MMIDDVILLYMSSAYTFVYSSFTAVLLLFLPCVNCLGKELLYPPILQVFFGPNLATGL
jgi:hypothetical protein